MKHSTGVHIRVIKQQKRKGGNRTKPKQKHVEKQKEKQRQAALSVP